VRLLMARLRVPDDGIEVLGFLDQEHFTTELLAAKALVAPSLGGESFGMVLTRALACATPVIASDIPGYRDVMTPETCLSFPAGDGAALVEAVELLADEPRRRAMGVAGRELAQELYSWDAIARRLIGIYESAIAELGTPGGGLLVKLPEALLRIHLPKSIAGRIALGVPALAGLIALFLWRGPSVTAIGDAFASVEWQWVVVSIALNLLSVLARAAAWTIVIRSAMRPPHPAPPLVFSAFSVGLFANAVLPGRIGELARVAVLTRKMPERKGAWPTLVGTVSPIASSTSFPSCYSCCTSSRPRTSRRRRARRSSSRSASASVSSCLPSSAPAVRTRRSCTKARLASSGSSPWRGRGSA
jgi:Glycosyltransferase